MSKPSGSSAMIEGWPSMNASTIMFSCERVVTSVTPMWSGNSAGGDMEGS